MRRFRDSTGSRRNLSSPSAALSPATDTEIVLTVSPAAKFTVPPGSTPPAKSAPVTAEPLTPHATERAAVVSPVRVTLKVKGVVPPAAPSATSAVADAMEMTEALVSSLRIVLVAVAVPSVAPVLGLDKVTVKASLASTVVLPATLTVIVRLVWPAAKLTVPDGRTPPTKSAAVTAAPLTAQWALWATDVSPVRVTVKVNGVLPD